MSSHESRQILTDYERSDSYVFHGSIDSSIEEFEPRQALSFGKPDGEPAVFAAASLEPAIFMAIIGSRRAGGWDSDEFEKPFGFFMSESNMQKAHQENWQGYVYVLDKTKFTKDPGWVWRSHERVKPIAKFLVTALDLPDTITVLSDADETAYVERYS